MTLKEQYKKETNLEVYILDPFTGDFDNTNYVEWLEAKINYTRCCTELKTVNEPLPYAEWKANLKMQKIEETIFKIGNDYKTMNDLLDMYGSYCNSF